MISFNVNVIYILDLRDDFMINTTEKLYEFIGKNPIKAFCLGMFIKKWFKEIDQHQQYLYSKDLRHNNDDIKIYQDQVVYWTNKFYSSHDKDAIDYYSLIEFSEYIFNNIFWNEKTEEKDKIRLALFLGLAVGNSIDTSKELNIE